jgi:hypothetical protein
MRRPTVFALACLAGVFAWPEVGNVSGPGGIEVFRDEAGFGAKGELTTVDFENLPADASSCPSLPFGARIDNPLIQDGVLFTDPSCLTSGYCSSPTCPTANIVLHLNQGATIELPPRNRGVLVQIEGMGGVPFVLEVEDRVGRTVSVDETGILFGTVVLGFRSAPGIARVRVARVGPTPPDCPVAPCGPLVLSSLSLESR